MISIYGIKNYKIPAAAMIAWCRMCRPGSIMGGQQQYLIMKEKELMELGQAPHNNAANIDLVQRDTVLIIIGTDDH